MSPKEYLSQYLSLKAEKLNLIAEKNLILIDEALPSGMDYSADRVQASPNDKMVDVVARIEKRSRDIDERLEKIDRKMNTITNQINGMDDAIAKRLLFLRYIAKADWYAITEELIENFHEDENKSYNVTYVRGDLHNQCLKRFWDKYKEQVI